MKSTSGIARRLLTGMLFMLCSATAMPQGTALYTVEIVVFRNAAASSLLPDARTPPNASDNDVDVEVTPVPTSKLVAAVGKLRKNGFEILAHKAWTQNSTPYDSHRGPAAAQLGLGGAITGRFFVYRGDYLSVGMDLTLEEGGRRYRLNQVDRVKPNQIRYFDSPAMGVIAIVSPATAASPAAG